MGVGVDICCFRLPSSYSPFLWSAILPPTLGTFSVHSLSSKGEPLTHAWPVSAAHTWIQPCLKLLYH